MTWHVQISAGGVGDLGYHVVVRLKYRRPILAARVAGRCEELNRAKASEHGWPMAALEIMPDQVHLLVKTHRSASPSRIARLFKGITSRRLRAGFSHLRPGRSVLWSRSYCAVAVGAVPAQAVCGQISTQHGPPWRKERAR